VWVMIDMGVVVREVLTVSSGRDGGGHAQGGSGSSDDGGVAAVMVVVGRSVGTCFVGSEFEVTMRNEVEK